MKGMITTRGFTYICRYDKQKTGHVHYEDFRNMAEQFGMQLDDDSLLALYMVRGSCGVCAEAGRCGSCGCD